MTILFLPITKKLAVRGSKTRIRLRSPKILGPSPGVSDVYPSASDVDGHYDLDGVSLTKSHGVIVASDASNDFSMAEFSIAA